MVATDIKLRAPFLKDVARVQPGYLSRLRVHPDLGGTHFLLQAKDVSPGTGIRTVSLLRFRPQRQPHLYEISRGDILVTSRGHDRQAYLVHQDLVDTLASNVFYIVRPHGEKILPAYLAWWLNLPQVQALVDSGARGTGIGYIAREVLEQLPVVVPPIAVQEKIAKTLELWRRHRAIQARLDQKREQLIHAICRQAVQQEGMIP